MGSTSLHRTHELIMVHPQLLTYDIPRARGTVVRPMPPRAPSSSKGLHLS